MATAKKTSPPPSAGITVDASRFMAPPAERLIELEPSAATGGIVVDASRFVTPPAPPPPAPVVLPTIVPRRRQGPVDVMAMGRDAGVDDPSVAERAAADDLVAEAERGRAMLEADPGDPSANQALEGNYLASGMRSDALWAARDQARGTLVARSNPKRPFVEREAQRYLSGNLSEAPPEPAPFMPPERDPTESDAAYALRVDLAKEAYDFDNALAMQEWEQRRPEARDIGRDGNIGFIENERRQDEEMAALQTDQVERLTALETEHARATADAYGQMAEANRQLQERQRKAEEAITIAQNTERTVRRKLDAMPAANASKFTDDMGAGGIIAALVGAAALGFAGDPGAMARQLSGLDARSLEEQKLNFDLGLQAHQDARDGVNQAMDVYQAIRNGIQDEEASGLMYLNFRNEQYQAQLREEMALTDEPQAKLQIEQTLAKLEEERVARAEQLRYKLATTPDKVVRRVGADPFKRKLLEKEILEESGHRRGMEMKQVDIVAGAEESQRKIAAEEAKAARTEMRGEGGVYKEAAQLADKIAPKQALISQINGLKKDFKDGIPGVGAWKGTETAAEWISGVAGGENRAHEFRKRVENLVEKSLRDATGAAAADHEVEKYVNLIMEGDGDINGEAKIWQNLEAFAENLELEVDTMTRGRSPEAVEYLTRNKALPERDAINIGRAPTRQVVRTK